MRVTAGVTTAHLGCDLLLCRREIAEFISDGYKFDVRLKVLFTWYSAKPEIVCYNL